MRVFTVQNIVIVLVTALLLSACTANRFYTPNTMQVPMLEAKGNGTVSAGLANGENSSGWEAQAIYSPMPHLGIMANHFSLKYYGNFYDNSPVFFNDLGYKGQTRLTEGGVGGYMSAGPKKEYLLSLFAGFGKGFTQNQYEPPQDKPTTETFNSEWNFHRWFLQPALGMKYRRFQVGTGIRFVLVDYLNGAINSRVGLQELERIELLESSSPIFLTEIVWTIGWRIRPVVISLNSTGVVRGKNSIRELQPVSNHVSLTLGLNFHELKKK